MAKVHTQSINVHTLFVRIFHAAPYSPAKVKF